MRFVSLPQSRAKYSPFHFSTPIFLSCPLSAALSVFLSFVSNCFEGFLHAGALSTPRQTQCNEAMPWSGKHGLITRVYLPQFGTVEHAVQFIYSFCFHGSSCYLPLKPFSFSHFQQPRVLQHVTAVVSKPFVETPSTHRTFHRAVLSPFSWKLSFCPHTAHGKGSIWLRFQSGTCHLAMLPDRWQPLNLNRKGRNTQRFQQPVLDLRVSHVI